MTKEQYDEALIAIRKDYELKVKNLDFSFANQNNPYKIGDIICGNRKIIRIEEIQVIMRNARYPRCAYNGALLTKYFVEYKNGRKSCIFQEDVTKKLN